MEIQIDMYQTLALSVVVLMLGQFLKQKINFLEKFCIPSPVVGGLIFSVLTCILYSTGVVEFTFDDTLREVCMVFFFTSVGFQANLKVLKSGGKALAIFLGLVIALISAPGTFFISNDGFYFGVLPVLAEAGRSYGFTNMQMALASLMGQAFHLLSPLVAFIYLLLRLTGLDMGQWQKEAAKYALGIFVIFVVTIVLLGHMPFYIPQ